MSSEGESFVMKPRGHISWSQELLTELRTMIADRSLTILTPLICISPHLHQSVIPDTAIAFPITDRPPRCHRSKSRSFCETLRDRKTVRQVRLRIPTASFLLVFVTVSRAMETGQGGGGVLIEIDSRGTN